MKQGQPTRRRVEVTPNSYAFAGCSVVQFIAPLTNLPATGLPAVGSREQGDNAHGRHQGTGLYQL
jgi:hypothetical protein